MNLKHGKRHSRAYSVWCGIKNRCLNPNEPAFKNYGGRGITVCERWQDFGNFYADMGDPPDGHFIERRRNDLGYSPDNCVWATRTEQNRNRRGLRLITIDGETLPLSAWVERIGSVPYATVAWRIRSGMDPLTALTAPKTTRRAGIPHGQRLIAYDADPMIDTPDGPMPLWKVIERSTIKRETVLTRLRRGWSVADAVSLPAKHGPRRERGANHGVQFHDEARAA